VFKGRTATCVLDPPRAVHSEGGGQWVVPEKIHTPPTQEISAVRRGRGEKIVSDNSKCIRTSEGGMGG
jgi:hypothetical protein